MWRWNHLLARASSSDEKTAWNVTSCVDAWVLFFIRDFLATGWKAVAFHWAPSRGWWQHPSPSPSSPLLFTQLIPRGSPGSQGAWGRGDLLQHHSIRQGMRGHLLLQVDYDRRIWFVHYNLSFRQNLQEARPMYIERDHFSWVRQIIVKMSILPSLIDRFNTVII